ncbi:stage II sporulation protein D [Paenibacillus sp. CAA11]|uniref:stage II sporulation protein D n=1 Tax=Paenibacillus sp. CAA11 TaxID=1532905 RepID=UPI001F26A98F|nr:stage II sporulation protein D [Paenibacillus sp. CAA11]
MRDSRPSWNLRVTSREGKGLTASFESEPKPIVPEEDKVQRELHIAFEDSNEVGKRESVQAREPYASERMKSVSSVLKAGRRQSAAPAAKFRLRWGGSTRFGGRRIAIGACALVAAAILLPAALVDRGSEQARDAASLPAVSRPAAAQPAAAAELPAVTDDAAAQEVSVYLTGTGAVETLPLEEYVTGVIAAEMPADFELEALKAQAIAARTFIVRRLAASDRSGVPGGGADVTDTVRHQAYLSKAKLAKWEEAGRSDALAKLKKAVAETRGLIMTYKGKPITASFFSASGGSTENSEDYWSQKIPYLRSVASPWEAKIDPKYKETVSLSLKEVFTKLDLPEETAVPASGLTKLSRVRTEGIFQILSKTKGASVKEIAIAGHKFTGREVREKLGLRSSQFTVQVKEGKALITTYGYGHGVGMSQWGANGMAAEGYQVKQILEHYYTGIQFQRVSEFL